MPAPFLPLRLEAWARKPFRCLSLLADIAIAKRYLDRTVNAADGYCQSSTIRQRVESVKRQMKQDLLELITMEGNPKWLLRNSTN
jgi:hypothetical protein